MKKTILFPSDFPKVLPVLPFCKFVCTNSSNQISFVRLTLYHFLLLSPLIKIEKVDPVYSVTIWVLLPSDNTIRLPHDWENGALVYSPLRLYIPLRQSYLNQYRDLYPLLSGKTSSVLPVRFNKRKSVNYYRTLICSKLDISPLYTSTILPLKGIT